MHFFHHVAIFTLELKLCFLGMAGPSREPFGLPNFVKTRELVATGGQTLATILVISIFELGLIYANGHFSGSFLAA